MFQPFDPILLILPTALIWAVALIVTLKVTGSLFWGILGASIKAGIFFVYYGWIFDGQFTFLDDWTYLEMGSYLNQAGVNIFNFWLHIDLLGSVGGGDHWGYYLYNAFAMSLFGEHYFAPVVFNIILSVFTAWLGIKLVEREFHWKGQRRRLFFMFLLLHPDIMAWSTVMNGKDMLVLFLHVVLIYAFSLYSQKRFYAGLLVAVAASTILFYLRFYVPLLFLTAFLLQILTKLKNLYWFLTAIAFSVIFLLLLGKLPLGYAIEVIQENFVNVFYGLVRFILTPIPFGTEPAYRFLDYPMVIYWSLMPFLVYGAYVMIRSRNRFALFLLVYLLVFWLLYAVTGELQGPRHRVQLDYALALLQFIGLWTFLHRMLSLPSRTPVQTIR